MQQKVIARTESRRKTTRGKQENDKTGDTGRGRQ